MILKGMELRGRDWRVFANEPGLDTILAVWLIFNHVRVQQKEFGGLDRLCALVRLEGIIDSHGLEMAAISGFAPKSLTKTKKLIEYLRAEEVDLKSKGIWRESDLLEYAALILHKVDRIIYKAEELGDVKDVTELARVEFDDNRIAVVVETQLGIYELESYLDRLYGERLGLVILKKDEGTYTLRSWDPFMPGGLNAVYKILNFIDPAVKGRDEYGRMWQTPFSDLVRNIVGIPTIAVGNIFEADHANTIVAAGRADLCALARPHLADPAWTLRAAAEQQYDCQWCPPQYRSAKRQLERNLERAAQMTGAV